MGEEKITDCLCFSYSLNYQWLSVCTLCNARAPSDFSTKSDSCKRHVNAVMLGNRANRSFGWNTPVFCGCQSMFSEIPYITSPKSLCSCLKLLLFVMENNLRITGKTSISLSRIQTLLYTARCISMKKTAILYNACVYH